MAISRLQKIQLIALSKDKNKILGALQNFGMLQINETDEAVALERASEKEREAIQKAELNYANAQYAIKLLSPYGEKRGMLAGPLMLTPEEMEKKAQEFKFNDVVKQCNEIEDALSKAKNELSFLSNEHSAYTPWKNLIVKLENLKGTKSTYAAVGLIKILSYETAKTQLEDLNKLITLEVIKKDEKNVYVVIIYSRELDKDIKKILAEYKFQEAELPSVSGYLKDHLQTIEEKIRDNEKIIHDRESDLKKLATHLEDLKTVHDYLTWQKDKTESARKLGNTEYSFVINGWVPKSKHQQLEETVSKITKDYSISELPLKEDEAPPVMIKNSNIIWPFETLTRMYGLPRHDELDPTPYLSVFFVFFFALCLTDAAYGIIMFAVTALALKYLKLGEGIKRLVKLLMYGGLVTAVVGALFGGWFGLEASKMPEFLTYTAANGEKMFIFQQINSVTNPLAVLILALALGFIQILFGTYLKLYHNYTTGNKKDALLDTGTWAFMLTAIGFYILAAAGVLPSPSQEIGKWLVILGTLGLILTQGRDKKNIIVKVLSGVLSLYGLVSYMSDILSYSRLLALGLATTIIGLAVNVIVELAAGLPYIGWIVAAIIFIGGHLFNLVINTLGSFIHSGRLQFVEFFSKFMEGGGKEFKPFDKKSKYVYVKQDTAS